MTVLSPALLERCAAELARSGQLARVTVTGDPMYGVTLRWGTVTGTSDGRIMFAGDLHDCAGIRDTTQSVAYQYVHELTDARNRYR